MKNTLIFVGFVAVGLIGALVFLVTGAKPIESDRTACTMDAKICPDGSAVSRVGPSCEFAPCPVSPSANVRSDVAWKFKDASSESQPRTEVTLVSNGRAKVIGTYDGSCSAIDDNTWKLLPNEKSGVICWFAGQGVELGVFDEGGSMVLKQGVLDEGSEEVAGTRGSFKILFSL